MHKKKILLLVDWFSPGFKAGGPIRSCINLTDHLKNDFDFFIITSDRDLGDLQPYPGIKTDQWILTDNGIKIFYLSKENTTYRTLKKLLTKERYDTVYLNSLFSWFFTLIPLLIFKLNPRNMRLLLAPRGMLEKEALAIKPLKKKLFLTAAKTLGLYKDIVWHATKEEEKKSIIQRFGKNNAIIVAPNLPQKMESTFPARNKSGGSVSFIFLARIAQVKNLDVAIDLLLQLKNPGKIIFHVYGPMEDEEYWNQCLEKAKRLPSSVEFAYKGMVEPAQIPSALLHYHFLFLPTRSENFGHSILEALAAGCPVIISDQTPWKNLEKQQAGWDIPLNNTAKFHQVMELCIHMDQETYGKLSLSAFEYAKKITGNEALVEQSRKLFLLPFYI